MLIVNQASLGKTGSMDIFTPTFRYFSLLFLTFSLLFLTFPLLFLAFFTLSLVPYFFSLFPYFSPNFSLFFLTSESPTGEFLQFHLFNFITGNSSLLVYLLGTFLSSPSFGFNLFYCFVTFP